MKKLIVFSDLDGTFLDHNNYKWSSASEAVNSLKKCNFPLIFNSSKTSKEIRSIRNATDNSDPFICENGAALHLNENMKENTSEKFHTMYFAKPYKYLRETLNDLQHDYKFTGFGDITIEELMELTGLKKGDALAAKSREATEPLLWNGSEKSLQDFIHKLKSYDLSLTKGGRFYHLMSPVNKGDSINFILNKYKQLEPSTDWITIGLGDSNNDIPMLKVVDYPVLIKNTNTKEPDTSHIKNLIKSNSEGPEGWNKEILKIIKTITG